MKKHLTITLGAAALGLAVTAIALPAAIAAPDGQTLIQVAACGPCAARNPCAAKNPCAGKNPCAAKNRCAAKY